ncbi:MAG: hypothetical protein O3C65_04210 [Proteobacteria bacterium]|nr:hypothetical protein [Pseudomonadota bacterium]MDA1057870.1 hypothetical protein [Pseudomonadota bacterium]
MSLSPSLSEPTIDPSARFADPVAAMPAVKPDSKFWGADGLRFGDLLDTLNPLQHIPVVSTIYRNLTGDDISPAARMAGDGVFGGPLGFLSGLVNTVIESATGRDLGGHMLALLPGDGNRPDATLAVAAATTSATDGAASQDRSVAATLGDRAAAITRQAEPSANAIALAALRSDLRSPSASAPPVPSNTDALSALRRDLSVARGSPAAQSTAPIVPQPGRAPRPNLFAAPLSPPAPAAGGPTQADGRKSGEYSAAELASIFRSYQRAAEAAVPTDKTASSRVED